LSINSTSSKHVRLNLLNGDELEVKYLDVYNAENKKVELKASATWNLEK
jgi:hypothetical protein